MVNVEILRTANKVRSDLGYELARSSLRKEIEAILEEELLIKGVARFVWPQEPEKSNIIILRYYNAYVSSECPNYRPEYWEWHLPLAFVLTANAKDIVEYLKESYGLSRWRPHRGWPVS